ncbi:MAG TPA: hypothetical protein IAB14_03435 [Candidatus Stercoripulliclostridium merdipullorum]|uniref:SCP2 domain-containing protein n=1 Tax=Candidatus Stercoripulliclostridium merdipullorum TaxID=2840952 RepID=A0A9D1NBP1_9FIRM|nr:hypothetical protein [Candidatus Stercoripulliclostridium merdipullorum]
MSAKAQAFVNFYAAIGTLEKFVELDPQAKEIAKSYNLTIRFDVGGGPDGLLIFKDGTVQAIPYDGRRVDIHLICPTPEKFNDVVDGKAMPLPVKGLFKTLKFMGSKTAPFSVLTDRMGALMRQKEFKDQAEKDLSTKLKFYAMVAGLAQVANHDPIAQYAMKRIVDGEISIEILGECAATLIKKDGQLTCVRQPSQKGRAFMQFTTLEIAAGVIDGKLDAMSCISDGSLITKGHMLMLDNVNKILNILPKYLS